MKNCFLRGLSVAFVVGALAGPYEALAQFANGGGGPAVQSTPAPASGAWPVYETIGGLPMSGTNGLFVNPATGATFPISGSVSITGTVPLPTNAATSTLQPAINADGGALAHVQNFPTTQAVTATTWPLPTSASTSANQTATQGTVAAGTAASNSQLIGGVFNSSLPAMTNGQQAAVQLDASGRQIVVVAPYTYTPLTPGQHTVANVAATSLTVPTGATYATLCASGASEKYTTDGTTTPTSTVGMLLTNGACLTLSGASVIANLKIISATGTFDVEYFR